MIKDSGAIKKIFTIAVYLSLAACFLLLNFASPAGATEREMKFNLRPLDRDGRVFNVVFSFSLAKGKKAFFTPPEKDSLAGMEVDQPLVELQVPEDPGYKVEAIDTPGGGWVLTAGRSGEFRMPYRVTFQDANPPRSDGEDHTGDKPALPINSHHLKVLSGSQLFMCPWSSEKGGFFAGSYVVELDLPEADKVLVPWSLEEKETSFRVDKADEILENVIAWGDLKIEKRKTGGAEMVVGFSRDFSGLDDSQRSDYADGMSGLMEDLTGVLGKRPELEILSVALPGKGEAGLSGPASGTLRDSAVIVPGSTDLKGAAAAQVAKGLFELWNRWSMVPEPGSGARWFQEGLSNFYGYRIASQADMVSAEYANSYFASVYLDYVNDPDSRSLSLIEAEKEGGHEALLGSKGVVVCASLDKRLRELTEGEKGIDWLLERLAGESERLSGRKYTLLDIEEELEDETGKSWDRFFADRVQGTRLLPTSDFSETDLFGASYGTTRGRKLTAEGSGKSWIFLTVALLIIFLIPVVFGAYVRRAVKMDLRMPRILPPDEDENEGEQGS